MITLEQILTIKHLIYKQKVPFNGTEGDCVSFPGSEIQRVMITNSVTIICTPSGPK